MGAVDQDAASIIYLGFKDGQIKAYNRGETSMHKGWQGYIIGFVQKDATYDDKPVKEFHIMLAEGNQLADLGMRMGSGATRSFLRCVENINLRQPVTIYPGTYKGEDGKIRVGWIQVEQGGVRIAQKYSEKEPGEMPPMEMVPNPDGSGTEVKSYAKQLRWLIDEVLINRIQPKLQEILEKGQLEPPPPVAKRTLAPALSTTPAALPPAPAPALPDEGAAAAAETASTQPSPQPIGASDDDDLPF